MHHANLLIGTRDWALSQIPEPERIEGPDISVTHYERMSIANVRSLIHEASLRPIAREYRTFILVCDSLLHEAQNALLKLFEEPNAHTVFYLIIPREDMLLPTLRSRLNPLGKEDIKSPRGTLGDLESTSTQKAFDAFLKLGYVDRLKEIGERVTTEDSVWLTEFLHGLELYSQKSRNADLIRDTLMLASYIHTAGSSKKMLLEHIALTL